MFDAENNQYVGSFEQAGIYEITVCAVGEGENSKSAYSEKTVFERYIKLKQPIVNTYYSNSQLMIQWEKIEKANLYELHITSSTQETKVVTRTSSLFGEFESINLSTIITTLELPHGDYQLSVIAKNSTNVYYTESFFSTPISFNHEG